MTLTVEDGTGKIDATAFCDVAFVTSYAQARNLSWPANANSTGLQEACCSRGGDYLRNESRWRYRGTKKTSSQSMPWPRTGATERTGQAITSTEIPYRLKEANAVLAILAANSGTDGTLVALESSLDRGGRVKRSKVDVLETEYFDDAPSEAVIPQVAGILAPLLRDSRDPISGYSAVPEDETPYIPGEFSNP